MAQLLHWGGFITSEEQIQSERAKALVSSVLAERQQYDAELADSAFHESAHACMALYFGHAVKSIAICAGAGECIHHFVDTTAKNCILISLASIAADAILYDRDHYELTARRFNGDVKKAKRYFRGCREKPTLGMLHDLCDEARAILERPAVWECVKELAAMLLDTPYVGVKRFKAPQGSLARKYQRQRAERRRTSKSFRQLMKSATDYWKSGTMYP